MVFGVQIGSRRELHWLGDFVQERSPIYELVHAHKGDVLDVLKENAASLLTLTATELIVVDYVDTREFSSKVIKLALLQEKGTASQDGHLILKFVVFDLNLETVITIQAATLNCLRVIVGLEHNFCHFEIFYAGQIHLVLSVWGHELRLGDCSGTLKVSDTLILHTILQSSELILIPKIFFRHLNIGIFGLPQKDIVTIDLDLVITKPTAYDINFVIVERVHVNCSTTNICFIVLERCVFDR